MMKSKKKNIWVTVGLIVLFVPMAYESIKSLYKLSTGSSKMSAQAPLLNALFKIDWTKVIEAGEIFFAESLGIVASILLAVVIVRITLNMKPVTEQMGLVAIFATFVLTLTITIAITFNQTQLDLIAAVLAIAALAKPLFFSQRMKKFVNGFLHENKPDKRDNTVNNHHSD